ncbi:MAG TPA: hypothetical protein VF821_18090, partial [Lentzea sp.]
LLYSGNCTPEQYERILRPEMKATDPAFSGTWARDHERLPCLMRTLSRVHPGESTKPVTDSYYANRLVHIAVARRLVPDGASLLQQAHRGGTGPTPSERDVYDRFFLVLRAEICARGRAAQLLERLALILCDVALHGLEPFEPGVVQLRSSGLLERLRSEMDSVLMRVAESVHAHALSTVERVRRDD